MIFLGKMLISYINLSSMKNLALIPVIILISYLNTFSQVYKFKSTNHDVEKNYEIVSTIKEVTYHTFDFDNKKIIFEGKKSDGNWVKLSYPMNEVHKEEGFITNYVFKVNYGGVIEIWFSLDSENLGYDLANGLRYAYYGLERIK